MKLYRVAYKLEYTKDNLDDVCFVGDRVEVGIFDDRCYFIRALALEEAAHGARNDLILMHDYCANVELTAIVEVSKK